MSGSKSRKTIDIEQLVVWAMRDQGLGWAGKDRHRDDFSDLGTLIDDDHAGSHPNIGLWSDDDAMLVKLAIDRLPVEARVLLVQYGRSALRPDWCEDGYGSYQQLRDGRGRKMWDWADPKNRTGEKRPRMGFVGEQRETVDYCRAQSRVWWQGLADIVGPLNNVMERNRATGPEVEATPWLSDSRKPVIYGPDGSRLAEPVVVRKVAAEAVESLRERASQPILAQANDWGAPVVPIKRKQAR